MIWCPGNEFNDKLAAMPSFAENLKTKYCHGDNTICARYIVFKALGQPKVPADLYPNQEDRAKQIIAEG